MSLDTSGLAEGDGEPTPGSGSDPRPSHEAAPRSTGAPRLFDDQVEHGTEERTAPDEHIDEHPEPVSAERPPPSPSEQSRPPADASPGPGVDQRPHEPSPPGVAPAPSRPESARDDAAPHRVSEAELAAAPHAAHAPSRPGGPPAAGEPTRVSGMPAVPVAPVGAWPTPAPTAAAVPTPDATATAPRHLDPRPEPRRDPESDPVGPDRKAERPRARKVRRIVRHVDPWSVLKVSLLFYFALFVIVLVASVLLWNLGRSAGTVDRVERFVTSLGFGDCQFSPGDPAAAASPTANAGTPNQDGTCDQGKLVGGFKFQDGRIMQAFAVGGLVLVIAGTAANTVLALLFNIISDLTGGVRFTVLEEDPISRASGSPR